MTISAEDVGAAVACCPPSPDRDRTEAFLARTRDWMRADDGHVTSSAIVLDASGRRTLLIFHRKLGRWLQPGGHVEAADRDLASAALREAIEETGISDLVVEPGPVHLDVHWVGTHFHYDLRYVVRAPAGAEPVANREVERFRWATAEDLETVGSDDSVRDLFAAAIARAASVRTTGTSP